MSGFSKLLGAASTARSSLLFGARTPLLFNPVKSQPQQLVQQIRGSHGRVMPIRPGKFYTKKYFDLLVGPAFTLRIDRWPESNFLALLVSAFLHFHLRSAIFAGDRLRQLLHRTCDLDRDTGWLRAASVGIPSSKRPELGYCKNIDLAE